MRLSQPTPANCVLGSVVVGFVQGLSTRSASGVITSMSTVTSTYYSTRYGTTTSTQFTTTLATTLTQTKREGPYLDTSDLVFTFTYYVEGNQVRDVVIKTGGAKNLMSIPVEDGIITILLTSKVGTATEEVQILFGRIEAGAYLSFSGRGLPVGKQWYITNLGPIYQVRTVFRCSGISVEAPVTTYTFTVTATGTYATTSTATLTVSEPLDFLGSTGGILLFAVAAIAVIALVLANPGLV